MFAQLIITILITWLFAETLCRLLLGRSAWAAVRQLLAADTMDSGLLAGLDESHPDAELARQLRDRQEELLAARARLDLAARTSQVTESLAEVEEQLAQVRQRLAEVEHRRRTTHSE